MKWIVRVFAEITDCIGDSWEKFTRIKIKGLCSMQAP